MPKRPPKVPSYRHHKGSGQAFVQFKGDRVYLGKHGTPESEERYRRFIAELVARPAAAEKGVVRGSQSPGQPLLTVQLAALYWQFAEGYYVKDGRPTSQLSIVRRALKILRELYGHSPAADFGPLALQAIQKRLIDEGKSRQTIIHITGTIKALFKWAVSQEILPAAVYQAVATVSSPKQGRSAARDPGPVLPVPDEVVDETLPFLPPVLSDMVRLQRLTGMRPGEVRRLRPGDLDRSKPIWEFHPASHKTEHHGRRRIIFIGPKAQAILARYLLRPADAYCFSPAESEALRNAERRAGRKSKVQPPQQNRRKARPRRTPSGHYSKDAYARAVARACEKAFGMPAELMKIPAKLPREEKQALRERAASWREKHCWTPNQLRHAAGTDIRRQFGLEAAQTVLGHAKASVTEVYAERDYTLAAAVMEKIG